MLDGATIVSVLVKLAFVSIEELLQMSRVSIGFNLGLAVEYIECSFKMPITGLKGLEGSFLTAIGFRCKILISPKTSTSNRTRTKLQPFYLCLSIAHTHPKTETHLHAHTEALKHYLKQSI